jgi:hypothetical protein
MAAPIASSFAPATLKHHLVYFQRHAIADAGQAGMVGRLLGRRNAQELPQGKAVGAAPGDASLRADAFIVADQQHAKVNSRRDGPPAQAAMVVRRAHMFDRAVEIGVLQQPVELLVEDMSHRPRQIRGGHPQLLLFFPTFSQRHRRRLLCHAMATSFSCSEFSSRTISTGC